MANAYLAKQKALQLTEKQKQLILELAECNMNGSEVARMHYYHRNGVSYHYRQIHKKTGLNPRNFYDLVELVKMAKQEN